MKFLIALSILASSSVFAQNFTQIKCFEPADQGERGELAYVLEERGNSLHVVFPETIHNGNFKLNTEGCLETPGQSGNEGDKLTMCLGQGQQIGHLVPIEATVENENENEREEDTVYCQKRILDHF